MQILKINIILFLLSCILMNCTTQKIIEDSSENKTQEVIYGKDLIPDEESAIQYVDLILSKYIKYDIAKFKPYEVSLDDSKKIWKVKATMKNRAPLPPYKILININRNNGKIEFLLIEK